MRSAEPARIPDNKSMRASSTAAWAPAAMSAAALIADNEMSVANTQQVGVRRDISEAQAPVPQPTSMATAGPEGALCSSCATKRKRSRESGSSGYTSACWDATCEAQPHTSSTIPAVKSSSIIILFRSESHAFTKSDL